MTRLTSSFHQRSLHQARTPRTQCRLVHTHTCRRHTASMTQPHRHTLKPCPPQAPPPPQSCPSTMPCSAASAPRSATTADMLARPVSAYSAHAHRGVGPWPMHHGVGESTRVHDEETLSTAVARNNAWLLGGGVTGVLAPGVATIYTIPCHTMHAIPCHTMHAMPYHAMPYHAMPYHAIPYM